MLHVLAHSTNLTPQAFWYNGEPPLPSTLALVPLAHFIKKCCTYSLTAQILHHKCFCITESLRAFNVGACSTRSLYKVMLHVLAHSTNRTSQVFLYNGEPPLAYTLRLYRLPMKCGKISFRLLTKIKNCAMICTIS